MPNPGSYREFTETSNLDDRESSMHLHSEALQAYRQELAEAQGLSTEELHRSSFAHTSPLGKIATGEQIG